MIKHITRIGTFFLLTTLLTACVNPPSNPVQTPQITASESSPSAPPTNNRYTSCYECKSATGEDTHAWSILSEIIDNDGKMPVIKKKFAALVSNVRQGDNETTLSIDKIELTNSTDPQADKYKNKEIKLEDFKIPDYSLILVDPHPGLRAVTSTGLKTYLESLPDRSIPMTFYTINGEYRILTELMTA
jgi:hypothetical protein